MGATDLIEITTYIIIVTDISTEVTDWKKMKNGGSSLNRFKYGYNKFD